MTTAKLRNYVDERARDGIARIGGRVAGRNGLNRETRTNARDEATWSTIRNARLAGFETASATGATASLPSAPARALRLLLAFWLAIACALAPAVLLEPRTALAASGSYVFDEYDLFDDSQLATLEASAESLASKYNMGVYLLVVDDMGYHNPSSDQRTAFATSYYSRNDLGLGSGKDGIMFVIAVDSRDYVTIAYGQGSYSFSDDGIADMEENVTSQLSDNKWYAAAETYYDDIGDQLAYYADKGKPWKPFNLVNLLITLAASLGIPGFVAYSKVRNEKAAMLTAREQSEASDYLDRASFVLTDQRDQFIRTTVSVTPRPKQESSGGGGWGGGGGGGFSSSGGGKF